MARSPLRAWPGSRDNGRREHSDRSWKGAATGAMAVGGRVCADSAENGGSNFGHSLQGSCITGPRTWHNRRVGRRDTTSRADETGAESVELTAQASK
jgi:hypothetical protein